MVFVISRKSNDLFLWHSYSIVCWISGSWLFNPLGPNPTKWSSTFKQFVGNSYLSFNYYLFLFPNRIFLLYDKKSRSFIKWIYPYTFIPLFCFGNSFPFCEILNYFCFLLMAFDTTLLIFWRSDSAMLNFPSFSKSNAQISVEWHPYMVALFVCRLSTSCTHYIFKEIKK